MFLMMRIFALLLMVPVAALAGPAEDANGVIDRWAAAFSANDAAAVQKFYAPDATILGTVSPTLTEGTDAIRAYFSRLPGSGNKVVMADRRTVVLGDGAVAVGGFYEFTTMRDGNPVAMPARFTMVLVKLGGDWAIAHHHSSQRPKPAA